MSVLFSFLAVDDLLLLSNLFSRSFLSPFPPVSDFLSLYLLPFLVSQFLKWPWLSSLEPHLPLLCHLSQPPYSTLNSRPSATPQMSQAFLECQTLSLKALFPCLAEMLFFYLPPPFLFLVFSFQLSPAPVVSAVSLFLPCPCLVFVCSWYFSISKELSCEGNFLRLIAVWI